MYVIGKDLGSMVGYTYALFHPEKILGVVSLGVAFKPPGSKTHKVLPEGYYINRWKVYFLIRFGSWFSFVSIVGLKVLSDLEPRFSCVNQTVVLTYFYFFILE